MSPRCTLGVKLTSMSSRKHGVSRTPSFLSVIALDNYNHGISQNLWQESNNNWINFQKK